MAAPVRTRGPATSRPPSPPSPVERLHAALAAVPGADLHSSMDELARAMPVPLGVESLVVRLLATGSDSLYLVAAVGGSPRETIQQALQVYPVSVFRSLFVLGREHSISRGLGVQWVQGRWLLDGDEPIGVVAVSTRTERRPTAQQRELLTDVAERLAVALKPVDRSTEALARWSGSVAYAALRQAASLPNPALDSLRPRERDILVLYAEDLSAEEIGRLLFISPHTVRTHVKNAFRRLGVHSREEAAQLVYADEIARIT